MKIRSQVRDDWLNCIVDSEIRLYDSLHGGQKLVGDLGLIPWCLPDEYKLACQADGRQSLLDIESFVFARFDEDGEVFEMDMLYLLTRT